MQLKCIKAYGFKSFADKIEIDINSGITGIVGPNGSGKSNIVDAVKWVLGEQSVKALRGSMSMSDVIFQGSSARKPLSRASVSLEIDNKDHYLNSDFKDIEIKRTVYSSGENEYTINGSKVRLKDITDLFLDSGAGKEAFSIISQGKIGEILNGKPEDRRAIIEEAAGVLKYKKRKIESLKKLDKTNDNLTKIDLIINEISTQLEPLKIEAEKAKKYQSFKSELESIEVSLLVNDISKLNEEYEDLQRRATELRTSIEDISSSNSKGDAKQEKLKLEILQYEQKINLESQKLLEITEKISSLEAQKQVISERKKYDFDDVKLANNIIDLKSAILELQNTKESISNEIANISSKEMSLSNKAKELETDLKRYNVTRTSLLGDINFKNKLIGEIKNKIDITTSNLENDSLLPYAVKSVLNNPRIKGIYGTLGKLIDIKDGFTTAIDTVLGSMQNVIVTENEKSAQEAINYLKENRLGRATFFPLNIIKPKFIDATTLSNVKSNKGFIGIASDLVTYDTKFKNIILNQLGNVIVVKNMNDMNEVGKIINYSYRVVTIDGELLHTGGSMSGGALKTNKNSITERNNLEHLKSELSTMVKDLEYDTSKLENINSEIEILEKTIQDNTSILIETRELLSTKKNSLDNVLTSITSKEKELFGTEGISKNSLDQELEEILSEYYKKVGEKNALTSSLEELKNKKSDLQEELAEIELNNKKFNSEYNKKVSELSELEVKLGKMDIRLDNLLIRLADEYDMTYERAKIVSNIPENIENERSKVQTLRKSIKDLGEVSLGSISEFERINTRYEFLSSQKRDLSGSIDDLLKIIGEMDATMEKEFSETFKKVDEEFKKVYRLLFKGGHGNLVLTDPDNLLETGVDIIAEPPGKRLKNISLLSGGEKTLTAIALLFAILNVKPVPFCILDEVEAALDEANVETFGNYLKEYENKTQFIVITHKKKTMEYASTLYGITMQESGVSKLVSVKLEDIKK